MNVFLQRFWEYCTWRVLAVGLAATVFAAVAGPFGTYVGMSFGERRVYWALVIGISMILGISVRIAVTIWLSQLGRNAQDVLVPVLFAFLFTAVLDQINQFTFGHSTTVNMTYLETFLFVLAISGFMGLLGRAAVIDPAVTAVAATPAVDIEIGQSLSSAAAEIAPPAPVSPDPELSTSFRTPPDAAMASVSRRPRLLDRIDGSDTASVVRLTVDDHYVIVYLDDGSTHKLLMRFADAVAEMADQQGLLSHRSHWVALSAIAGIARIEGREMVRLTDGSTVPISRTCRPGFVALGLLASPTQTRSGMSE